MQPDRAWCNKRPWIVYCLVPWSQRRISFSLFCFVAFSYLYDCLHVFALLACLVIHALISCFMPCLYAYFTHACYATTCTCHVISCILMWWVFFSFHHHIHNISTCHAHTFWFGIWYLQAMFGCFLLHFALILGTIRDMIASPVV